jgi:cytochrome b561
MYTILLVIHSWFRWLVLASLLYAVCRSCYGWITGHQFTAADNSVRHVTATVAHVQFLIGIALYFVSPVVMYFLQNFNTAVHQRDIRFFGMEHITMMLIAICMITIGSVRAKRKGTDRAKFKTLAIWYGIGFIIIFLSIPWEFSPFTSRPYLRS